MYVAPPGYVLLCPDYSQIELRVLAAISKDDRMCDIYRRGEDLHAETARAAYGLKRGQEIKETERRHAKAINFGVVYGLQAMGLAAQLGVSVPEAQEFIDRFFDRFPGVAEWQAQTQAFCTQHGFVYTMFGRRRLLADAKEISWTEESKGRRNEALRQAINAPIQGTASDICLTAFTALKTTLNNINKKAGAYIAGLVSTVHDQILLECREDRAVPVARVVKRVMCEHPLRFIGDQFNGVPIQVDFKAGNSWGGASKMEV